MVAPAVEGIDLFKIAGRSISGWVPSFKMGTTAPVKQPFCSQSESPSCGAGASRGITNQDRRGVRDRPLDAFTTGETDTRVPVCLMVGIVVRRSFTLLFRSVSAPDTPDHDRHPRT